MKRLCAVPTPRQDLQPRFYITIFSYSENNTIQIAQKYKFCLSIKIKNSYLMCLSATALSVLAFTQSMIFRTSNSVKLELKIAFEGNNSI